MRLRRRKEPPPSDGEFKQGGVVPQPVISSATIQSNFNLGGNATWTLIRPQPAPRFTELERLRTANRHARELVDRLLVELATARAASKEIRGWWLRDSDLIDSALARIESYRSGDGSRRRDVLADIEDLLGR